MKRRKLLISFEFSQFRCHSEGISSKLVSILYWEVRLYNLRFLTMTWTIFNEMSPIVDMTLTGFGGV